MEKKQLKFNYFYKDDSAPSKKIDVEVEGTTRKELIENLISKQNSVALFYFMKYFPDISDETVNMLKKEIFKIEKIRDMDRLILPQHYFLITTEFVYFVSEKREALYYL